MKLFAAVSGAAALAFAIILAGATRAPGFAAALAFAVILSLAQA